MAGKNTVAKKATTKKATSTTSNSGGSKKSFFYVVYVDAYKDDKTIVPRGVYKSTKKIERFENLSNRFVEKFEGKIPDPKIFKLAEELRITVTDEDGDYLDSKDVLAEMVREL
mgnify:CR=1 FL=1